MLLLAAGSALARRPELPAPTVAPIPETQRIPLDVLVNPASTQVIRGATLTFPPNHDRLQPVTDTASWSYWGHAFWETWPIESWICPTMDHMVANGCNVVAFKGGATVPFRGYITWDEYLARWVDTINYAKSIGLRCFISYGDGGTYPGSTSPAWDPTVPTTTYQRQIDEWAQRVAATGNVIGVDVINEVWIWSHTDAELAGYLDAVRAWGLPATCDFGADGTAFGPLVQARCDFFDFHRYQDVTNTWLSSWRNSSTIAGSASKRVIMGEYGAESTLTTAARQSRYQTMHDLINADASIAGALAFSWTDFVDHDYPAAPDETTIPYWGMYSVSTDRTLTPRSDVVDIWKTWPTQR